MSVLQQSDLDARRFDEPLFIIRTSFVHHVHELPQSQCDDKSIYFWKQDDSYFGTGFASEVPLSSN